MSLTEVERFRDRDCCPSISVLAVRIEEAGVERAVVDVDVDVDAGFIPIAPAGR